MSKAKIYIFLIMLLQQTVSFELGAQQNYEIRRINFKGNKTLEKNFLLDKMAVDEVTWLQKLFTNDEPTLFSWDLIEIDLKRLKETYQSEGFVDVQVSLAPLSPNDKKKTVKLEFVVEEGEPFTIDTILFHLASKDFDIDIDPLAHKYRKKRSLSQGDRFRDEDLRGDITAVENMFRDMGHAKVDVSYNLEINNKQHLVNIRYSVAPGPLCTVGETIVTGNKNVAEKFIRKQIEYEEGELYNKSLLIKMRESLYHLQLFKVVSVLPEKIKDTTNNTIPVKIYVEEAPRIKTKFGVGYGTEDKFRAYMDFTYLGFLGTARRINIYAKHSALKPYYVSLKWTQPQIFNKKGAISLNPFIESNKEPGYTTRSYGINIPTEYSINKNLNTSLTYYLQNIEQEVEKGDVDIPGPEDNKFLYNKSGLLLSTVFSTEKPKFSPKGGINFSLGYKINGYALGGDFSYMRVWADIRKYNEIGNWVLAARLMGGGIHSSDNDKFIPVEDRFYSGGSNSIRGWSRSRLGPKRESGTPLGGKSILESNLELRFPIFWKIGGVVFLEAGNVWDKAFHYQVSDLGYATGAGLRVETPIGPVRLDVGKPFGKEKKSLQFFISVGQAF